MADPVPSTGGNAEEPKVELHVQENDDGSALITDPSQPAEPHTEDEDDDAPTGRAEDPDDGPTEQEELASAQDDTARRAIQDRRRNERKDRKRRAQEREEGLRLELRGAKEESRQLSERLALIEQRTNGSEMAQLDGAIQESIATAEGYKKIIAEATNRGDGAAVADATEKMVMARERAKELTQVKAQYTRGGQQPRGAAAAPAQPPKALVDNANAWMGRHSWYNPRGGDLDSDMAIAIDKAVARDGFNPTTKEYWDELENRVKKLMPHRAAAAGGGKLPVETARKPGRPSVVTGSSRESAGSGGAAFTLSKERVQALKDAGMWEDPVARAAMIKEYRDFDRKTAADTAKR